MDLSKLANPPARPGRTKLDAWYDGLTDAEKAGVTEALLNTQWGHVPLLRVLVEEGAPDVSEKAFRTWRVRRGWSA